MAERVCLGDADINTSCGGTSGGPAGDTTCGGTSGGHELGAQGGGLAENTS